MRRHQCENCHHIMDGGDTDRMYLDCPECGKRASAKFIDNPFGNGQNIMKYGHGGAPNVYEQIKNRPRGI